MAVEKGDRVSVAFTELLDYIPSLNPLTNFKWMRLALMCGEAQTHIIIVCSVICSLAPVVIQEHVV